MVGEVRGQVAVRVGQSVLDVSEGPVVLLSQLEAALQLAPPERRLGRDVRGYPQCTADML